MRGRCARVGAVSARRRSAACSQRQLDDAGRREAGGWKRASSRARLACRRGAETHPARTRGGKDVRSPRVVDTEVDLPRAPARPRRRRALPRVRAVALGRRASVPPRARARARGSRARGRGRNRSPAGTPACLFNSFNFDFRRLRRFARRGARMVHRVDGPIGAYRGFDDGTDARIAEINAALASATIFQSEFSLEKHRELGFELREPVVIPNAVDPAIFHPPAEREPLEGRKVRVVATSWSDNPAQGRRRRSPGSTGTSTPTASSSRSPGGRRRRSSGSASSGPLDSSALAELLAHAGRLRRTEPRRPVLERAARGARVRPAGRLPRERRASGARRRGRPPLPRGRGARRGARAARRGARRAACGDLDPVALVGRRPLPRGPRPAMQAT